ncbi:MAG: endo-1,4-beta-xylanase, partial [Phycisphaerae bacterium]|nr:endo-1,4-beta-xylanase [Phycisphaerae bacterium]
ELARGRIMRINQKREDWGLFDFDGFEAIATEIDNARDLLIEAVIEDDFSKQHKMACKALQMAVMVSDRLSHFHAELFLARRKQMNGFTKRTIGCSIDPRNTMDVYKQLVKVGMDFVHLPISWRSLEPKPKEINWKLYDPWIEWLMHNRVPIHAGPLVTFQPDQLPDWLPIGEANFEKVRDFIFDHVRRVVERYSSYVVNWNVVSGVHADNVFNLSFEQLMDLTRVTTSLVKQLAPRSQAIINITSSWGEYYSRNQKSIPPMLYADMIVQSGIAFDGIGVQFLFGAPSDGLFVRDMFQISEKIDRLGNFGKPVHITAVQVPSATPADSSPSQTGGSWRKPWDEAVQTQWIKEFYSIALSKPFVENVTWNELADQPDSSLFPASGLVNADLTPKPGYKTLVAIRNQLRSAGRKPPTTRGSK